MPVSLRGFFVISLALHTGAGLVLAFSPAEEREVPPPADRFAGPGVEVDAITLPPAPAAAQPAAPATLQPAAKAQTTEPPTQAPKQAVEKARSKPQPAEPPDEVTAPRAPRPRPAAVAPTASSAAATASAAAPRSAAAKPAAPESSGEGEARATGETAPATGGAFGSAGLPPGVRHLPNAFTRALAIANRGDRRWRDLPLGRAGEARVHLSVGDAGELGPLEFPDEQARDALAPVVRRLLDNTLLLLESGRFSLDPRKERPGTARLRVVVEISERSDANPDGDPSELFGVAWEAPSGTKPGKSGFVLNSGRQVTAFVWVE